MIGRSSRKKVKPHHPQQQHQHHHYINVYFDSGSSSSSSSDDNALLSSFAYALRKVRKSNISRLCDNREIEFIEKRFEDTSRVIFKDLENLNRPLLLKSLIHPNRSDIVGVTITDGMRVTLSSANNKHEKRKEITRNGNVSQATREDNALLQQQQPVPTIETIWQEEFPQTPNIPTAPTGGGSRLGKNAVSPAIATTGQHGKRSDNGRKGMCRVT